MVNAHRTIKNLYVGQLIEIENNVNNCAQQIVNNNRLETSSTHNYYTIKTVSVPLSHFKHKGNQNQYLLDKA